MPEIAKFVKGGAASITPAIAEKVLRQLPQWKLEFTQINAPKFLYRKGKLTFLKLDRRASRTVSRTAESQTAVV